MRIETINEDCWRQNRYVNPGKVHNDIYGAINEKDYENCVIDSYELVDTRTEKEKMSSEEILKRYKDPLYGIKFAILINVKKLLNKLRYQKDRYRSYYYTDNRKNQSLKYRIIVNYNNFIRSLIKKTWKIIQNL